jgi:integrase
MKPLSHEDIMRLQPGRRPDGSIKPMRYSFGDNLYLQCTASGRSWLFRYDLAGKCRWMGLGPVDTGKTRDSLAAARRKAQEARTQLDSGADPLAEKRAAAANAKPAILHARKTFRDAALAYLEKHRCEWRSPIHARQHEQIMEAYVLPVIGGMLVADVGPADVKRVLEPLWTTKREVARKTCGKIVMALNFAKAEGWRTAPSDFASVEVMSTTLGNLRQRPRHHPAMRYQDVPGFVAKLEARGNDDVPALALRWLILTGTRSSEARCPTWDEIDRDARMWTIPPHRTKNGAPHLVPLSDAALDVLDRVKRRQGCDFVFVATGSEPVTETSLRNLLRDYGYDKRAASLHGFRSSMRDFLAVRGTDDSVAEAAIAHYSKATLGTLAGSGASVATMRAYKRTTYYEQRIEVMKGWDLYLRFG